MSEDAYSINDSETLLRRAIDIIEHVAAEREVEVRSKRNLDPQSRRPPFGI